MTAVGNTPDIPDDRAAGVQIRGSNKKHSALAVLAGDFSDHFICYILLQHTHQRRVIRYRVTANNGENAAPKKYLGAVQCGVECFQLAVIFRTEKGKRCSQCTGAHSRNHGELGPRAEFAPADQHSGPIGAVGAAPGNRQIVVFGMHNAGEIASQRFGVCWHHGCVRLTWPMVAPDSQVLPAQHADVGVFTRWNGIAQYGRAGTQQQTAGE